MIMVELFEIPYESASLWICVIAPILLVGIGIFYSLWSIRPKTTKEL